MSRFDTLHSVRSAARERALEDEEYFAERVCGRGFDPARAGSIWQDVVAGQKVQSPSETFDWLFPEYVAQRNAAA